MNLNELKVRQDDIISGVLCTVRTEISQKFDIDQKQALSGEIKLGTGKLFELYVKNNFLTVAIDSIFDQRKITQKLKQKSNLKFCGEWVTDEKLRLYIVEFGRIEGRDLDPLCVLAEVSHNNLEELATNFILSIGEKTYIPYVRLNESDRKISKVFQKYKENYIFQDRFMLVGKNYNLQVSNVIDNEDKHYFFAEKKVSNRNYRASINLYEGKIRPISRIEFSKERALASDIKRSYLDTWKIYDRIESQLKLKNVREAGYIQLNAKNYSTYKSDDKEIYIPAANYNKKAIEAFKGERIFLTKEIPEYFYDIYGDNIENGLQDIKLPREYILVKFLRYKDHGIIVELEDNAIRYKKVKEFLNSTNIVYASVSILGDKSQIERRELARERIELGKSAKPLLGYIFEGKLAYELEGIASYDRNAYKQNIKPLSHAVKSKIFQHEPTNKQTRAIELALNTPDIAIIQGPPGTGKTTVISGIVERESELLDKREVKSGRVLLSSYQHDALNNLIGRVFVYSLPTVKHGNEKVGEQNITELTIDKWCGEYEKKLVEKNPKLEETDEARLIASAYNTYILYPTKKNAIAFLSMAKQKVVDSDILREIDDIENDFTSMHLQNNIIPMNKELITQIRKLRTKKISFLDDGAENARVLQWSLEDLGIDDKIEKNRMILSTLKEASQCTMPTDNLLEDLKHIKSYLLSVCIEKNIPEQNEVDLHIKLIYKKIKGKLKEFTDYKEAIVFNLLQNFQRDKKRTIETMSHYNVAFAATTQQCEGRAIRAAKFVNNGEHPSYEVVVVDEAARVIPSDLMIPMSQAKGKIILVGDHRQLPHMYDTETYENMEKLGSIVGLNEIIRKSFFEYLFEKAKELEKKDGYCRTITLDKQYRMHPVLGNFISDNFYKPYGEAFESPLGEKYFRHNLTDSLFPVEWYDVPAQWGDAERVNKSRRRICEIEKVIEVLRKYINRPGGKKYSYGIISFYREQVIAIKQRIKEEFGENFVEGLLVGSVDAFQGNEFDVVILSVVRTTQSKSSKDIQKVNSELQQYMELPKNNGSFNERLELIRSQYYGFISEENRLCVALSRQKRLLTVIGDSTLFTKEGWSELSEFCIPAMKRLYELCIVNRAVIAYEP